MKTKQISYKTNGDVFELENRIREAGFTIADTGTLIGQNGIESRDIQVPISQVDDIKNILIKEGIEIISTTDDIDMKGILV